MHLGDGLSGRSQERRWQRSSHRVGRKSGVKPVPRKGGPESRTWCQVEEKIRHKEHSVILINGVLKCVGTRLKARLY